MKYILGIDAGTTAFKAVLFDQHGQSQAVATKQYSLLASGGSLFEFRAEDYWNLCRSVIAEVLERARVEPGDVHALAVSSQAETLLCLDRDGVPLRNAIVWLDNRSMTQAEAIQRQFGARRVYDVTGQPEVVATWPATKILWLRQNEPDVFRRTHKYLLVEDYLIYRLTGRFVAEKSLLSSSLLLDIHAGGWWTDMLSFLGVSAEQLPELWESGQVVGPVTAEAAAQTGLGRGTLVVTGAMDQVAGMIGAGNVAAGVVTETTGAALAMCVTVNGALAFDPAAKVPCHCHAVPRAYCLMFWSQTAGLVLKWFCDNFYDAGEADEPGAAYRWADAQAATVPPGCEGLVMLPHLSGAACPEFDPYARGVFSGITLRHGRAHFARAVLESVAFMLNRSVEIVRGLGLPVREIRSLGGGARSDLWNAIKADVTGADIVTMAEPEPACLGAAILAGVGSGLFQSVDKACAAMVSVRRRFHPNRKNLDAYKRAYKQYLTLYDAVRAVFRPS